MVVLCDAGKRECSRLLHGGVKLLEAVDECVESARVYDGLREVGRVLGDGAEDVGGGLLVKALKFELAICNGRLKKLTFCSDSEYTSWGRISLDTTASASSSE